MPLADLVAALERTARDEAEAALKAARDRASRIESDALARVTARRREILEPRAAAVRAAAALEVAQTRQRARRTVLEQRERLIEAVFAFLEHLLPSAIETPAYQAAFPGELSDALQHVGDAACDIRCSPALVESARRTAAGRRQTSVTADRTITGFVVRTVDGLLEVDGTLPGRLERRRPQLRQRLVHHLLEGQA